MALLALLRQHFRILAVGIVADEQSKHAEELKNLLLRLELQLGSGKKDAGRITVGIVGRIVPEVQSIQG